MDIPRSIYASGINATWDLHISALLGSRVSIFALRSKSHGPLSKYRVSRRSEKRFFCIYAIIKIVRCCYRPRGGLLSAVK